MKPPVIKAEFILDEKGKPKGRASGHYHIKLRVDGAPPDTHAVTYILDPSYYDRKREARERLQGFPEELTSYGDYDIDARIRGRDYKIEVKRNLYDALAESHGESADPEIQKALKAIHDN